MIEYDGELVAEIQKNATEKVIVGLREFKGRPFADVRIYFEDESGQYKPTKKGVAIRPSLLFDLRRAIDEAIAASGVVDDASAHTQPDVQGAEE